MCEDIINEKYQQWIQTELLWLSKTTSKIDDIRIFACDGILSSEDDKEIRDHCGSEEAKFLVFYEKVKRAGFSKINALIRSLRENDQEIVAEKFERFKATYEHVNADESETDGLGLFRKKDFIDFLGKPLEVKVTKGTTKMGKKGAYKLRSNPKGLALIISIEKYWDPKFDREGGERDRQLMSALFEEFGYEVYQAVDVLNCCQLEDVISEFKKSLTCKKVDSCVVAIMGHGICNKLYMSDLSLANIYTEIIYKFDNTQCREFLGKPKIFFVQTCQDFVENPRFGTDSIIPLVSDMLICFSTIPGYPAYRHTNLGSLYVNCLVKVFMENAHNTKITKMLQKVGTEITKINISENRRQVSCYSKILFGEFFFNPGL